MNLRFWASTAGLVLALGSVVPAHAATMNFTGNFRAEADSYNNLGLSPSSAAKNYIGVRALLNPNLVVDDHFSIKSQWSLLTSGPTFTPNPPALGVGQGSWLMGDPTTASLVLSRAWL